MCSYSQVQVNAHSLAINCQKSTDQPFNFFFVSLLLYEIPLAKLQ